MAPSIRSALADPQILSVLVYSALAIGCVLVGYFSIFGQFAPHDDEGTLLVSLDGFVDGDPLYRDIYSPYGPFYYEVFGAFFALTGLPVGTDASRTLVVVVWVATSLVFGAAAQRATGSLGLGAVAMIASFACLNALIGEPMHPHGLGSLLLAALVLAVVAASARPRALGALAGFLVAALVLTKLNVGAFAIAAIALATVLAWRLPPRLGWLRWPVIIAFLAMPVAVMARDLDLAWVRDLIMLQVLAGVALIVASWPSGGRAAGPTEFGRWLAAAIVGFLLSTVAILAAALATGPSPADLFDGIVREAMRVRDVLLLPLPFPPAAVSWGVLAVVGALCVRWLQPRLADDRPLWAAALRGGAGIVILFSVTGTAPVSLNPPAENPVVLPMLLAWVAAMPPRPSASVFERFARIMIPALAIAETLQVYPVAGSQMRISAVLFVPVAAICLGDALSLLRGWSRERAGAPPLPDLAPVLLAAILGVFALNALVRPGLSNAVSYGQNEPLPFKDASLLRLPEAETATYAQVVAWLRDNRCTTFIGYPNVNSLYLWSGIEPPAPRAPGAWIEALSDEDQQRVVDEMRSSPLPCAIRNQTVAAGWLGGEPPPPGPLVDYIGSEFRTVETVGPFELMLPKSRAGRPDQRR